MWDSQRKKKERERERENFAVKDSKLTCSLVGSQNKGLSQYHRRASQLPTGSSPLQEAEADVGQPELESKGHSRPQSLASSTKLSRLLVANHIFLGSWMLTSVRRLAASYLLSRGGTWRT